MTWPKGIGGYRLGVDQAEFASDILFKSQAYLQRIYKDLSTAAITAFRATPMSCAFWVASCAATSPVRSCCTTWAFFAKEY